MGAAAAALAPIMTTLGEVAGLVGLVSTVDDMVGSPIKKGLGLVGGPTSYYGVDDEYQLRKLRARGLSQYLNTLKSIAPGYAKSREYKSADNWNKAWHREYEQLQQAESYVETFDAIDRPGVSRLGWRRLEDGENAYIASSLQPEERELPDPEPH
jgi:hypothetical protein